MRLHFNQFAANRFEVTPKVDLNKPIDRSLYEETRNDFRQWLKDHNMECYLWSMNYPTYHFYFVRDIDTGLVKHANITVDEAIMMVKLVWS